MPKNIDKEINELYKKLYNEVYMTKFRKKLPTYRELLQKYDCSRQVLNKTIQRLKDDKIITVEDRVGIFANIKNNNAKKKIIFAHVDWVCEHINYLGKEFAKILTEEKNYIFSEITFAPHRERELIENLNKSDADLILLELEDFDFESLNNLKQIADKTIFFESSPMFAKVKSIDFQPHYCGMLAAKHLLELGHKDIALIVSEPLLFANKERIYGFLDYLKLHKIKPQIIDCKIKSGFASAGNTLDFMNDYLDNNKINFTACFTLSDNTAKAVVEALANHNIRVPDDVSVIGWGGASITEAVTPTLSAIALDMNKIIKTTVQSVEQFFENGKCGVKRIPPILIQRESTKERI